MTIFFIYLFFVLGAGGGGQNLVFQYFLWLLEKKLCWYEDFVDFVLRS